MQALFQPFLVPRLQSECFNFRCGYYSLPSCGYLCKSAVSQFPSAEVSPAVARRYLPWSCVPAVSLEVGLLFMQSCRASLQIIQKDKLVLAPAKCSGLAVKNEKPRDQDPTVLQQNVHSIDLSWYSTSGPWRLNFLIICSLAETIRSSLQLLPVILLVGDHKDVKGILLL